MTQSLALCYIVLHCIVHGHIIGLLNMTQVHPVQIDLQELS